MDNINNAEGSGKPKKPNKRYNRRRISTVEWTTTPWLDKADTLELLRISSRTLQTWRTNRIIDFSQIRGKMFYKETDVQKLMESRKIPAV
jgi:hypothetical protein